MGDLCGDWTIGKTRVHTRKERESEESVPTNPVDEYSSLGWEILAFALKIHGSYSNKLPGSFRPL